jgi:hypothetical protein
MAAAAAAPHFARSLHNLTRRTRDDALPDVVSHVFGIDSATPVDVPVFVFMVGSPGAGKSGGHDALLENGVFPDKNYATINIDLLLEMLLPFRVAGSFAHSIQTFLGSNFPKNSKSFSSIGSYCSKKPNVGSFKFLEDIDSLQKATIEKYAVEKGISVTQAALYISAVFDRIKAIAKNIKSERSADISLIDLTNMAIKTAIKKKVNIVYETTFSSIHKFDNLYKPLLAAGYKIIVFHIMDTSEHIREKLISRQEYGMPYETAPFYRYVPTDLQFINQVIHSTASIVDLIHRRVKEGIYNENEVFVDEYKVPFDPSRLRKSPVFNFEAQLERLLSAYTIAKNGGKRRTRRRVRRS